MPPSQSHSRLSTPATISSEIVRHKIQLVNQTLLQLRAVLRGTNLYSWPSMNLIHIEYASALGDRESRIRVSRDLVGH